jgi:hypothetical protein
VIALSVVALAALSALLYLLTTERSDHAAQRREWAQERATLLNRIKPETAQPLIGEPEWPSPKGVVPDDDEAFWAARGIDVSGVR